MDSVKNHEATFGKAVVTQYLHTGSAEGRIVSSTGGVVNFDDDVAHVVDKDEFLLSGLLSSLE